MAKEARLVKQERLRGRKTIGVLFSRGNSFVQFPFRVTWILSDAPQEKAAQTGVVVPKRNFKRAVKRNLLKRRIREAYRKNKHPFYEALGKRNIRVKLMIVYTAREALEYKEIEQKINVTLQKLINGYDTGKGRSTPKTTEPRT